MISFGIPIKSLPIASVREFGLMVARIMSGLVAARETIR